MSTIASPDAPHLFNSPLEVGQTFWQILESNLPFRPSKVGYASPIPGLAQKGYSPVYRNRATGELKTCLLPGLDTYLAIWKNSVANFADQAAFSLRPYSYATKTLEPRFVSTTYAEVDQKQREFGAGLLRLLTHSPYKIAGCDAHAKIDNHAQEYQNHDVHNLLFVLTLYLANRAEWVLTDLACSTYSITNTVLYDTLGPSASQQILELTALPVVVTSFDHVQQILDLKRAHPVALAALIAVVCMDPLNCNGTQHALVKQARDVNIELFDMDQVCGVGRLFPHQDLPPATDSCYTISFTSGTTGSAPKGVVIPHKNAAAAICFLVSMAPFEPNDSALSFLPLAHIFERHGLAFVLTKGGCVGFPQMNGSPLTLVEDLKLFKPKHMANVPRVYSKFEAAIKNATLHLDLPLKRALFAKIVATKSQRQAAEEGALGAHWLYDRVFLPAVRKLLGYDNMTWNITGLAPISPLTVKFLKAALGVGFCQGYGLTELFAGFAISMPWEKEPGLCGPPGVSCDIRVRELPDLGYHLDDPQGPRGELELRGPQIFSHYFENPEETAKVLKDGWFATGDVARIDKDTGRLYIVDRVKNFFKLAQGEYVTPDKIENIYLSGNPLLTQCFVHGDSLKSYLVAVVGVDPQRIVSFLTEQCSVRRGELETNEAVLEHTNRPENRAKLLKALNVNISGLQGFEMIHNLHVEFEPLRLEREVITPTIKIRRPIAAKFFAEPIEKMYAEGSLVTKPKI